MQQWRAQEIGEERIHISVKEMPISNSVQQSIWPGLGLFGESYLLFSVGTLHPIWEMLYDDCFNGVTCPQAMTQSLTYSVVLGVIVGMIVIGVAANRIGRRKGSILTASLMSFSSLGMTISSVLFSQNPQLLFTYMAGFLFIFGIGVGGEYPLSASSASEKAMEKLKYHQTGENQDLVDQTSGKSVILVFAMQGWGIVINSVTLTFLLMITGQFGDYPQDDGNNDDGGNQQRRLTIVGNYNINVLLRIWQIIYAIGGGILLYVLISRYFHLSESSVWAEDKEKRLEMKEMRTQCGDFVPPREEASTDAVQYLGQDESQKDANAGMMRNFHINGNLSLPQTIIQSKLSLLLKYYGYRFFGTSITWALWDVAFYGNKLFQSSFLLVLTGQETTLLGVSSAATLNACIALVGYYAAAFLIDRTYVGRLRLQLYGFIITGSLFYCCAVFQNNLTSFWLIVLYFGSSFFGQCGPNCTTFLIPAEVFPTEIRTLCHGLSAAAGKCGALLAAVLFNYVSEKNLFYISGFCSLIAGLITYITIPESTSLDLYEQDVKWRMILDGKQEEYSGPASDMKYLSRIERWQSD